LQELREHVETGFFSLQAMSPAAYERARRIARRWTARTGLRTLDIMHVASALLLQAEMFLTFDQRQLKLARSEGLITG
jgi:hypothetical protein